MFGFLKNLKRRALMCSLIDAYGGDTKNLEVSDSIVIFAATTLCENHEKVFTNNVIKNELLSIVVSFTYCFEDDRLNDITWKMQNICEKVFPIPVNDLDEFMHDRGSFCEKELIDYVYWSDKKSGFYCEESENEALVKLVEKIFLLLMKEGASGRIVDIKSNNPILLVDIVDAVQIKTSLYAYLKVTFDYIRKQIDL